MSTPKEVLPRPGETICVVYDGPDTRGRYTFALCWHDPQAPVYKRNERGTPIQIGSGPGSRAQFFFAELEPYEKRAKERGDRWVLVDER